MNYASVDYLMLEWRCKVIDCAFEDASNRLTEITDLGTNQSVSFDGWKYDNYTTQNVETGLLSQMVHTDI